MKVQITKHTNYIEKCSSWLVSGGLWVLVGRVGRSPALSRRPRPPSPALARPISFQTNSLPRRVFEWKGVYVMEYTRFIA